MAPSKQHGVRKAPKTSLKMKMAGIRAMRLASTESSTSSLDAESTSSAEPSATSASTASAEPPASPASSSSAEPSTAEPVMSSQPMSASKRKISLFPSLQAPAADLPTSFIDLSLIQDLYSKALCPQCKEPGLQLRHNKHQDRSWALHLQLTCPTCEDVLGQTFTSKQTTIDKAMDTNRRFVLSGLTAGLGHAGLLKISEGLGMSSMHEKTYRAHFDVIINKTEGVRDTILQMAREKVVAYYREREPNAFGDDGILNVGVSYDGTWARRGHTSKIGAGAIIEIMTGLVIDFHVMSLYCQMCVTKGERLRQQDPAAYAEWLQGHKTSCNKNYEGSSGGMEVRGALVMWGRSQEFGMRYTTFVGDGDTKTFMALCAAAPYGTHLIVKEECVNHVSKRLNTGLRNLVSTMSKKNVRLGGNKKGSLSAPKIGLLQSYYTKAVRTYNSSVEEMSRAIWAAFYHSVSTKDQPQHDFCPVGDDTWCWYQRALKAGPVDPALHDQHQKTFLNQDVAGHVKAVYERLTDPALLGRCLLGKTQNTNESLHSVIWAKCPKHTFSGLNRVRFGVTLAVGEYNMGSSASHIFLPAVGCALTSATTSLGQKRDAKRIRRAEVAHQAPAKKRREIRKQAEQRAQQQAVRAEGGPSYVPGGF